MISISRVKQATSEFIKVLRFGKLDVQTSEAVLPYGIDSKPVKEVQAVHSTTNNIEQTIILGYIKSSDLTEEGETRIYSTDSEGVEAFYLHLKKNGDVEFGGDSDNFVRYAKLNSGLQDLKTKINTELTKIQAAISSLGGAYAKVNVSVDISESKIEKIKTL